MAEDSVGSERRRGLWERVVRARAEIGKILWAGLGRSGVLLTLGLALSKCLPHLSVS